MTEKTALWIAHVSVSDPERYGEYAKRAPAVIAEFGGVFLSRAADYRVMEGVERARHVVTRFPSLAQAVACYESAGYQEALSFAKGASERDLVIVEENC